MDFDDEGGVGAGGDVGSWETVAPCGGGSGGEGEAEGGDDGARVFAFGVGVEIEESEEEKFSGGEAEAGAERGGGFRGAREGDRVRHRENGER